MIFVAGISWITNNKLGTACKKISGTYENKRDLYSQFKEKGIIQNNIKNFGRFDYVSKNTCLVISLTLYDADISYLKDNMQSVGILSTNEEDCLNSNIKYFKDYVDCGRKLSRGNLFIYTLPSTPIAEAAINFGCQGPVAYFTFKEDQTNQLLEQGRMMIERKETTDLLLVNSSEDEAICFYLRKKNISSENGNISLEKIQKSLKSTPGLSEIINNISQKR